MSSSAPIQWESLPLPVRLVMERLGKQGVSDLFGGRLSAGSACGGKIPRIMTWPVPFRRREMEQLLSPYPVIGHRSALWAR